MNSAAVVLGFAGIAGALIGALCGLVFDWMQQHIRARGRARY